MGIFGRGPTVGDRPSRRDRRRQRARPRPTPARRQETERRTQLLLGVMMAIVVVVVVGLGAYGYYDVNIRPKHEPVIRVGERSFDMAYTERYLRYVIRDASPGESLLFNERVALQTAINQMVDNEMERLGAPTLGLSVSEEEIDAEIREQLRIPEGDTEAFATAYRKEVRESGLKPNEYREGVTASLLSEKLKQYFRDQVPATADQVRARDIRVETQEEAQKVLERLGAGEDFTALAAELSLDTATNTKGGDMDWVARGSIAAEIETVLFALEINQLSEPLAIADSYQIYQVLEKAPAKEVTTDQGAQIEDQLYSNWRSEVGQGVQVVTYMTSEQAGELLKIAREEGAGVSSEQP
jgi:parvulin-like peptidyl-prolyl isomerase